MTRVLLVEDEADLRATLDYNLRKEGYHVIAHADGEAALERLGDGNPWALAILDLMLPGMSGLEICRELRRRRETAHVPVLMLTAKGEEIDRVVGFEMGADDYVVKPFSVRELMLRVKALLKRTTHTEAAAEVLNSEVLNFGLLKMSPAEHRLWVDEKEVRLTSLEFRLLQNLLSRKGRVQTRDALLSDVWGIDADITTRTVDTHVKRLREKLGAAGDYVETLRGVGYRFRSRPDEDAET